MTERELLERIRDVDGRLVDGQEFWLHQKVLQLPDESWVLEIGTFHGRSTCAMALGCVGTNKRIFTVDIDPANQAEAQRHLCQLDLAKHVMTGCFDSGKIRLLWGGWCVFSFVFIDGDHRYGSVFNDFREVLPMVIPNGRIALHDVTEGWPDVLKFWKEYASGMLQNHEFCTTIASGTV